MIIAMTFKLTNEKLKKIEFSEELISRSVEGDKEALAELAALCLPRIWRSVYLACGGGSETDDIVQNAVIDALAGLPSFRGAGSFSSWLNRVAVRAAWRHLKRRAFWSIIPFSDKLELFADTSHRSPDKRTEEHRLLDRVAFHMKSVKLTNRLPLVLSIVHGYSTVEIADAMNCSVETAKKRLQRGRIELGNKLQKDPYCKQVAKEVGI